MQTFISLDLTKDADIEKALELVNEGFKLFSLGLNIATYSK